MILTTTTSTTTTRPLILTSICTEPWVKRPKYDQMLLHCSRSYWVLRFRMLHKLRDERLTAYPAPTYAL